jgi:plasmid stabilization system protein ParE
VLTLVWRASALDDLQTIIGYIAERNVPAAERLQDAIEGCAERLPDHPYLYRSVGCPEKPFIAALRMGEE